MTSRSWKAYFQQYVYDGKMADFAVDRIQVTPVGQEGNRLYESNVVFSRKGATHPKVPLLFTFTDGHTVRKQWNGEDDRVEIKLQYKAPLAWVQIDPDYTLTVENMHINNYLKAEIPEPTLSRSNMSVTKLLEAILGAFLW
ncbi:hypothetical protein HMSSN139_62010 [Paenibacillus sp. HMSSN-139]|nr:hypothetical protein HMSSN139_62010 [Paenibacillus sp. HMSSN-139]